MTTPRALLFSLLAAAAQLVLPASVAAQPQVLVMAEAPLRDELAAALRIELASRGAEIAVTDPPVGPTRVARAAQAQRSAQEAQAIAALWLDRVESDEAPVLVVRVAPSNDGDVRQAPVGAEGESDARGLAMVAASLLDELLGPVDPPVAYTEIDIQARADGVAVQVRVPTSAEPLPPVATSAAAVIGPAAATAEPELDAAALPPPPGSYVAPQDDRLAMYGGVALLAGGLFANRTTDGLIGVRGSLGMRVGVARLGLEQDLAFAIEHPYGYPGLYGFVRLGITGGVELPLAGRWRLVFAGHLRLLLSDTWVSQFNDDPIAPSEVLWFSWRLGASLGARGMFVVPFDDNVDFELGFEMDAVWRGVERDAFYQPTAIFGVTWR